jgi:ribosome-binding protein aMBF1 (putative translation factor)
MTPCNLCGKEAAGSYWLLKAASSKVWEGKELDLCDSCAKPIIELLEKK